jgi:hypothetical protein
LKKPSKKLLTRKLDHICSEIVRSRGKCAKCSKTDYAHLQTAHIFSRKYRSIRWDIELNLLCLCDSCHFWAHANPILFTEFVREYLGEVRYVMLKVRAQSIKKWTIEEMQELLETLEYMHNALPYQELS